MRLRTYVSDFCVDYRGFLHFILVGTLVMLSLDLYMAGTLWLFTASWTIGFCAFLAWFTIESVLERLMYLMVR